LTITAAPEVSIIVVSFNSAAYLERSLETVANGQYEIIVVDNASTDGSARLVRERFPSARLVELERNVGFGAANNEGMAVATGRYLLLMNPDAWPEAGAIGDMVQFLDARPAIGVTGPRLRSLDGVIQRSAFGYPTAFWLGAPAVTSVPRASSIRRSMTMAARAAVQRVVPGDVLLVGTALLLRREAVAEIGGFDQSFFMFNEDVDLCWRLREAGWGVELCPAAEFVHVGGASTRAVWSNLYREQLRGHLLFLAKRRGRRHAQVARLVLLVAARARALLRRDDSANAFREASNWLASSDARQLVSDGRAASGAA
jgi:N-acetylglucosaminyl-diphospho-decaprenol L-rhamnosyltransferase